jgi:hypothetical protein
MMDPEYLKNAEHLSAANQLRKIGDLSLRASAFFSSDCRGGCGPAQR